MIAIPHKNHKRIMLKNAFGVEDPIKSFFSRKSYIFRSRSLLKDKVPKKKTT